MLNSCPRCGHKEPQFVYGETALHVECPQCHSRTFSTTYVMFFKHESIRIKTAEQIAAFEWNNNLLVKLRKLPLPKI